MMKRSGLTAVLRISAILAAGFALALASARAQSLTVSTWARLQSMNSDQALDPSLNWGVPTAMAMDRSGQVWVVDSYFQIIRTIAPEGTQRHLAGRAGGVRRSTDGQGLAAVFDLPTALALDADGNVWVGESQAIRKVTPGGFVTTVAKIGAQALAFDRAGNLYAASGSQIVRILPDGSVVAIAGDARESGSVDATGAAARFGKIGGMAIDATGVIFVSEWDHHTIRRVTPSGVVSTWAGRADDAGWFDTWADYAAFNMPQGLAFDAAGNLYVADSGNRVVRRIDAARAVTTVAGAAGKSDGQDGVGPQVRFLSPYSLFLDGAGTLYIGDTGGSSVGLNSIRRALDVPVRAQIVTEPAPSSVPAGRTALFSVATLGNPAVTYQWQRRAAGASEWVVPPEGSTYSGVTTATLGVNGATGAMQGDMFRVVVTNGIGSATSAAARLTVDAPVIVTPLQVSTLATPSLRMSVVQGLAVDATGTIYVADEAGADIRKFAPDGTMSVLGNGGLLRQPADVAVAASGTVYVVDRFNSAVYQYLSSQPPSLLAGEPGQAYHSDGRGSAAHFNHPTALVVEAGGSLIVADTGSHVLRRVTREGVVTTIAGTPHEAGYRDGPGGSALFNQPQGLGLDAAGNIYVADGLNHVIRQVTPAGVVTTVAGIPGQRGAQDGSAALARFNAPSDVAVDAAGNLFVTDSANNAVRKITPSGLVSTVAGLLPSSPAVDTAGHADGIGSEVRMRAPRGIVVDRQGRLIFTSQPYTVRVGVAPQNLSDSETLVLSAGTALPGTTGGYQWLRDSEEIPGATSATLTLDGVRAFDTGRYQVRVGSAASGALSAPLPVTVEGSRISNLSIRSLTGTDAQMLTVGFTVATDALPVLVRGVGPSLAPFGVTTAIADPSLSLYNGTVAIETNDNWSASSGVAAAAQRLGAFSLAAGSLDAAILPTLPRTSFTAQCRAPSSAGGIALVEIYDAGTREKGRLTNVSARGQVGSGEGLLIAGFNITGNKPKSLLLRGVGPGLSPFGVSGIVADPQLKVFSQAGVLQGQNDNWGDNGAVAAVAAAARSVGAFPLAEGSRDAVVLLTLAPGTYTAQLSTLSGPVGIGLIELYELP